VICVADLRAWRAWRRLSAWLHVEPPLAHDRPQARRSLSLCAGRRCERGRTCESHSRVRPATTPARRDASSCALRGRLAVQLGCGVSPVERATRRRTPDRRRCRPQPVGLSPTFTPPRAGSRSGGSTDASFGYELIWQAASPVCGIARPVRPSLGFSRQGFSLMGQGKGSRWKRMVSCPLADYAGCPPSPRRPGDTDLDVQEAWLDPAVAPDPPTGLPSSTP
jgi:hypothetical protein